MPGSNRMTTEEEKQATGKRSKSTKSATRQTSKSRASGRQTGNKIAEAKSSKTRSQSKPKKAQPKMQKSATSNSSNKSLPRLLERLRTQIVPEMKKEFGYTSHMQVPRLTKITLNIGMGESLENAKALENASRDLALISGQKPVATKARQSIAGFKIRQGMIVGVTVTLRGRRMYEFLDKLISSALPRTRDFQGVSRKAFDGRGNYSLGIREQVIFPEIEYNSIDRLRGLQIVIVNTGRTDQEGLRLLEMIGMPFTRKQDSLGVS